MKKKILIVTVLTLSMIACKNQEKKQEGKEAEKVVVTDHAETSSEKTDLDKKIIEKYWKLIELNGQEVTFQENQRKEAHFILKTAENKVTGNAGCNTMMGTYELLGGNKIVFSKMATTMMYCEGVENEQEFLNVFEAVDHYTLKEDTLYCSKIKRTRCWQNLKRFILSNRP